MCKAMATAIMLSAGVSEVLCSTVSFTKVATKVNASYFFMLHMVHGRFPCINHQIVPLSSSVWVIGAPGSHVHSTQ
jgi:hypothetical protein